MIEPRTQSEPEAIEEALQVARRHFERHELLQAENLCRSLLKTYPDHPKVLHFMARISLAGGVPAVAFAFSTRAIKFNPTKASYHHLLGGILQSMGRLPESERALHKALELSPDNPKIHGTLADVLVDLGRLDEALASVNRGLELDPCNAHLHHVKAVGLIAAGDPPKALSAFRQAVELSPGFAQAAAGVLFMKHYIPYDDLNALASEAMEWGDRYTASLLETVQPHSNTPDPDRRLRIGYLSGDLRAHPVGQILRSVLPEHDKNDVEVFCYTSYWRADQVTSSLRQAADHWRTLVPLDDDAAAALIREDEIDILIDLSGHTAYNRFGVMARKPAPIQAVWLGYFDTTGMPAMDFIIADSVVCTPIDGQYYREQIVRLPHSFLCYAPTENSPDVGPLPALSSRRITFGCMNNIAKITPQVISLWARILGSVRDSQLLLKSKHFEDAEVRQRYSEMFKADGIDGDQIRFDGQSPTTEYLAAYNAIDIALDPFPYNGGMTSLDALWMGVPVITLRGTRFVSRMGASILTTAGLSTLIAESEDQYVDLAIRLATDIDGLRNLREGLRSKLLMSPLCDGAGFTRALEAAYREMWRTWCATTTPNVADTCPRRNQPVASQTVLVRD